MEQTTQPTSKPKAGKGLGIAGLVLGILAAIISFIPCLGVYAVFPGIIGLILSVVSIIQANKAGAAKGMAIAGLVCSIIGSSLAIWQYTKIKSGLDEFKDNLENIDTAKLREQINQSMQSITDSLEQH